MKGLVIKNTGSWYVVHTEDGDINCKVKGNFRIKGIRTTNPVAVGDRVDITVNPDGNAFITAIEPRDNYIIRKAINLSKESHIIAANIDQAFLVVTLAHPVTSTTFIDRFLATAEAYRVKTILLINKTDLLTEEEDKEYLEAVTYLYRSIGYEVMHVSGLTGEGIDKLRERISDKISLFSGQLRCREIHHNQRPAAGTRTAHSRHIRHPRHRDAHHHIFRHVSCTRRGMDYRHPGHKRLRHD